LCSRKADLVVNTRKGMTIETRHMKNTGKRKRMTIGLGCKIIKHNNTV
jgi:hypothetical protein